MAGAGYKLFNTGDVLTAAQVNTYLQEQAVMRFASAAARTTALSGVLAEGMVSYLMDTNAVEVYDGSAWVGVATGDITAVTAGTGISGGGTSGAVTITNSMATEITAAGDIIVGTGSGTFDNLPIGTTGQVLTADTTVSPYKVKWATASSGGGLTLLSTTTLSGASTTVSSISGSYKNLILVAKNLNNDLGDSIRYRFNSDTGSNYYSAQIRQSGTTLVSEQLNASTAFRFEYGQNSGATNLSQSVTILYRYTDTDVVYIETNSYSGTTSGNRNFLMGTGIYDNSAAITSVTVTGLSGNTTGTLYIYGES